MATNKNSVPKKVLVKNSPSKKAPAKKASAKKAAVKIDERKTGVTKPGVRPDPAPSSGRRPRSGPLTVTVSGQQRNLTQLQSDQLRLVLFIDLTTLSSTQLLALDVFIESISEVTVIMAASGSTGRH